MTRRLIISYVLLAAFVLLVVELPLGLTYQGRAEEQLLNEVERDARVLAGSLVERVEQNDPAAIERLSQKYVQQTGGRVVVTNADGLSRIDTSQQAGSVRNFSTRPEFIKALAGTQDSGIRRSDTLSQELAYVAVPIASDSVVTGAVRVSFPTEILREKVRNYWLALLLLSSLVLAGAAAVGWLMAVWAVGPVKLLKADANRLAAGDLSSRTAVQSGPPELRDLADTFNEMAGRLEVLIGSQQAFVADASHQLRTPLTALRLRIESLQDALSEPLTEGDFPQAGTLVQSQKDVAAVAIEVERLSLLVDGLLALARSESSVQVEDTDIAEVTQSVLERWSALAEEHGVSLSYEGPAHASARVVVGGLQQILDNLLDNAITASPAGSSIDTRIRHDSDEMHLILRDHGAGIAQEDLLRATDRFWRAADAAAGGSGLGLAIVAELVAGSGGFLTLKAPSEGTGLVVNICFAPAR